MIEHANIVKNINKVASLSRLNTVITTSEVLIIVLQFAGTSVQIFKSQKVHKCVIKYNCTQVLKYNIYLTRSTQVLQFAGTRYSSPKKYLST